MKLTLEDKKKITARQFFTDCRDQYETYQDALNDVSPEKFSEAFINACTNWVFDKAEQGHRLLMNDVGHVAKIRNSDHFFEPLTEFTEEEGKSFEKKFNELADKNEKGASAIVLLQDMGWKLL